MNQMIRLTGTWVMAIAMLLCIGCRFQTKEYTLDISINGNGSVNPSGGTYDADTTVTLTATADSGWVFAGWSGDVSGSDTTIQVIMDSDKTITAGFEETDQGDDDDVVVDDDDDDDAYDLPDQCSSQCNSATPVYPEILDNGGLGNVTMYSTAASSGGACNYGETDVMYYAAMSVNVEPGDNMGQWQGGSICGQCAEVTTVTSQGLKKVIVRIMDKCPDGNCGIDLGGSAPADVMVDGYGRYDGSWRFVSCEGHPEVSDGLPSLDVAVGSNAWWSRVRVRNGKMAVSKILWEDTDSDVKGTFAFASNPENAYEVPVNTVLQSDMAAVFITIEYTDGSTETVTLSPGELSASGASYPLD